MKHFECDKALATLEFAIASSKIENLQITIGTVTKLDEHSMILKVNCENFDCEKCFEDLSKFSKVLKRFFAKVWIENSKAESNLLSIDFGVMLCEN